ncbi:hypothetical protein KM043_011910 [Ampulex compressa]|nr:hypothetical protein KM043_011910 [Ampulex compressa]
MENEAKVGTINRRQRSHRDVIIRRGRGARIFQIERMHVNEKTLFGQKQRGEEEEEGREEKSCWRKAELRTSRVFVDCTVKPVKAAQYGFSCNLGQTRRPAMFR